eukprot:CAMPEP_0119279530 /NCGR_PEP_ID=MMETSP1329-20130426/20979_1 /TAXON_ID=114041 /ORGANISM="Genus nov. species nov., Strain RCC1024" /LENGTH=61 /DNA_ID=CAMNT_0007280077 /DNA_START=72 /DNA_END=254 /DNA_ORIENTATION=+
MGNPKRRKPSGRTLRAASAPRAEALHFPEAAQAAVCELLCDLRLAETDDKEESKRLERYKK